MSFRTVLVALAVLLLAPGAGSAEEWYLPSWLEGGAYAPRFLVRDTESSLGPLAREAKVVTLRDLILAHGHACDGLVMTACALSLGLPRLFPDGVVDRTDACCVTNNSPCFGDVAAYLTGGRIRFGTQRIDAAMGQEWSIHRPSTGTTVHVRIKPGVFPAALAALERRIRAGERDPVAVARCRRMQDALARRLVSAPAMRFFDVGVDKGDTWVGDEYPGRGPRGDVLLRHFGWSSSSGVSDVGKEVLQ